MPLAPTLTGADSYRGAVGDLIDRPWLKSAVHKDRVRFTDMTQSPPELCVFVRKLLRRAARVGIPLECRHASRDAVTVVHGRRGIELRPTEWEVIAHLGVELIGQYRLPVVWGRHDQPWLWQHRDAVLPGVFPS